MHFGRSKLLSLGGIVAATAFAVVMANETYLFATNNFHAVIEGELFRSAQPSARQLESYVRHHGVKTVINLRGSIPGAQWYQEERRAAAELGITLIDFPMSAGAPFSAARSAELVDIFRTAEKPILVHCKAGADRTGLVSLIYAQQIAGMDVEEAEWFLSPLYGHFGIPLISPTFAMDASWEELEIAYGLE